MVRIENILSFIKSLGLSASLAHPHRYVTENVRMTRRIEEN